MRMVKKGGRVTTFKIKSSEVSNATTVMRKVI